MPVVVQDVANPDVGARLARLVLTIRGLAMGADQVLGLDEVTGLDDLPDIRTRDSVRSGEHGENSGEDFLQARYVTARLVGAPAVMGSMLKSIRNALLIGDTTLTIDGLPGLPSLQTEGKIRRRRIPTDRDLTMGVTRPAFEFYAPDPRLYAAAETVLTTGPGTTSSGGLAPPLTPPLTPSGSGSGGQVTAVNDGNTATRPTFRIDGPLPGFDVHNLTTAKVMRYRQALSATDYIEIDMDARTVLLNGVASRRSAWSGVWWDLPPGSSDLRFVPTGAAVGSSMEVRLRSAWL